MRRFKLIKKYPGINLEEGDIVTETKPSVFEALDKKGPCKCQLIGRNIVNWKEYWEEILPFVKGNTVICEDDDIIILVIGEGHDIGTFSGVRIDRYNKGEYSDRWVKSLFRLHNKSYTITHED